MLTTWKTWMNLASVCASTNFTHSSKRSSNSAGVKNRGAIASAFSSKTIDRWCRCRELLVGGITIRVSSRFSSRSSQGPTAI